MTTPKSCSFNGNDDASDVSLSQVLESLGASEKCTRAVEDKLKHIDGALNLSVQEFGGGLNLGSLLGAGSQNKLQAGGSYSDDVQRITESGCSGIAAYITRMNSKLQRVRCFLQENSSMQQLDIGMEAKVEFVEITRGGSYNFGDLMKSLNKKLESSNSDVVVATLNAQKAAIEQLMSKNNCSLEMTDSMIVAESLSRVRVMNKLDQSKKDELTDHVADVAKVAAEYQVSQTLGESSTGGVLIDDNDKKAIEQLVNREKDYLKNDVNKNADEAYSKFELSSVVEVPLRCNTKMTRSTIRASAQLDVTIERMYTSALDLATKVSANYVSQLDLAKKVASRRGGAGSGGAGSGGAGSGGAGSGGAGSGGAGSGGAGSGGAGSGGAGSGGTGSGGAGSGGGQGDDPGLLEVLGIGPDALAIVVVVAIGLIVFAVKRKRRRRLGMRAPNFTQRMQSAYAPRAFAPPAYAPPAYAPPAYAPPAYAPWR